MNAPFLRPAGCPVGVDPRNWRAAVESRVDELLSAAALLLAFLDRMDGDTDLEPDDENEFGTWTENQLSRALSAPVPEDAEEAEPLEDGGDAEPDADSEDRCYGRNIVTLNPPPRPTTHIRSKS